MHCGGGRFDLHLTCDAHCRCKQLGVPLVQVTLDCCQVFTYVHHNDSCKVRPMARQFLLHGSVPALDGHRRLPSLPCSLEAPDAMYCEYSRRLRDPPGEYPVRRTREPVLSHSIRH